MFSVADGVDFLQKIAKDAKSGGGAVAYQGGGLFLGGTSGSNYCSFILYSLYLGNRKVTAFAGELRNHDMINR